MTGLPRTWSSGFRVTLRPPVREDWPEFRARVEESLDDLRPWMHPPEDAAGFARLCARVGTPTHVPRLVCEAAGGAVVGCVNLSEIVRGALQGCYVGYYAFSRYAGRGYMTQGLALALDHAFHELALHRVEANIQPGNTRSLALAARLGFRREGFSPRYLRIEGAWRDHERWAITAEEFELSRFCA